MALEQTLISTTKLFFSSPRKPPTNTRIPSLFLPQNPLVEQSCFSCRQPSKSRLKCSIDYNEHQYSQAVCPKPAEIPWRKELTNSVHLIGVVGTPIEIKHLPSVRCSGLYQQDSFMSSKLANRGAFTCIIWFESGLFFQNATNFQKPIFVVDDLKERRRINLTFWDELAHAAYNHVEKGHQIYVSGRLVSDVVENDDGKQQTYYKVVVQQLNFVEKSSPSVASYDRKKVGNNAGNNMGSTEELWQAFFANPVEWWDNRKNKKNPKYPDFKHKDTGEALWVEGRNNPPWVKSQLAILDSRMGSSHSDDSRRHVNFMSVNDAMSF
ncbi:hypothetical protein JRO89_XS01G0275800 [Xanthoceras sorbifolium]|uniref:Uncharacterized protein n=1 Tax=Xanthoceras sorbifolium TaxID=99658 RepID=A0ABQ8ILZ9_9ROSI|nr:hypothetical protein JRO89_XS01G0275800 [Xanthoceras sorbifolium]